MGGKDGIVEAYEEITGREVKDDLDEILEKGAEKKDKETLRQISYRR
jgi:hypothetical protein